jgi:nucleoside-diphosphate-sugar epimerase
MKDTISILGCGWLGLPLAEFLILKGFSTKGSTTSPGRFPLISEKNIDTYLLHLNPDLNGKRADEFFNSEILIINIPPGGGDDKVKFHRKQVESILNKVRQSSIHKIIFISSTSVYGNINGEVTEEDELTPEKESGKALKLVEKILFNDDSFQKTIIRFAGLIDNDRNPVRYFAGRQNIPGGNIPVNLIHRKDCINIIYQVIMQNAWGEIFNACSDFHPTKREFYTASAEKLDLPAPEFIDTEDSYKIVNSAKIKNYLNLELIFPDPLMMI